MAILRRSISDGSARCLAEPRCASADLARRSWPGAETFEACSGSRSRGRARRRTTPSSRRSIGPDSLKPEALAAVEPTELLDTLREQGVTLPAGVGPLLKRLAGWFASRFPDEDDRRVDEAASPTSRLREELGRLSGVGQATADAILLHGLGRPAYPVDRGTYRILVRHGWIDVPGQSMTRSSQLLIPPRRRATRRARPAVRLDWPRWPASIARSARRDATSCPLKPLLPEGGPLRAGRLNPSSG